MFEPEYIIIKTTIKRTRWGIGKEDVLVESSKSLSDSFKDALWEDYSINIDDLQDMPEGAQEQKEE